MTVSSSTNRASYSGNGSLTTFAYGFKVFDQDDLTVILRASNGTETVQTITTDYTVTGVGDVGGGNVVFGTAPASGVTVVILREMDLEQGLDLVPNDPFPAQSLEDSLDKLTFMVQQHDEQLGRAIKASRTNVITGSEFVISAADRANKVFAFDSSGDVSITQEIGTFRGDWAASTAYVERDLVKDTTTNNVFIVNSAHTSSGSLPLTTNTNSAKYEKIIDITNPPGDLTVGGNISTSGSVTAGNFVIGSADINENDLEAIDSIIAGTVAASKAVVVDVNKDISSFRNLTATGDITFGGLSDGAITVTDILDEDDLTSNSATSLATQQSIKAYVDSQVGSFDTLAEVLANGSTTGGTNLTVSTGDDIKFADGSQAIFGAGDDLRINHNGSYSYISDLGQGPLYIGGNEEVSIMNGQLNEYKIKAETNGAVTLYYDNAVKMATTTLGIDVTGTITFDGGETTADFYFGDNDKAIFGAGSDLQIYHDGSGSYVEDTGTGNLKLKTNGAGVEILNSAGLQLAFFNNSSGEAVLKHINAGVSSTRLNTTSTGIDVTGKITADGLTVQTTNGLNAVLEGATSYQYLQFKNSGETENYLGFVNDDFTVTAGNVKYLQVDGSGDISFYEDTGTTPKFFWDASAESLGIGTSSPSSALDVRGESVFGSGTDGVKLTYSAGNSTGIIDTGFTSTGLEFRTGNSFAAIIDSSGRVGIGTSSPSDNLDVASAAPTLRLTDTDGYYSQIYAGSGSLIFRTDVGQATSGDTMQFVLSGSEAMRIDSSGNVGIGTSNPIADLSIVDSSTGSGIEIQPEVTTNTNRITNYDRVESAYKKFRLDASEQQFYISGTERMRIDSSGNLLVGKTNTSTANQGIQINPAGRIDSTSVGDEALRLNRKTSDGDIAVFRKDNTNVGSIGVQNSADMVIGSGTSGVSFSSAGNAIVPSDPSSVNAYRDAAIQLGYSGGRFTDLYLSGGVIQSDGGKSIFGGGNSIDTLVAVSVQGAANADAMEIKVRTNGKNAIEFRNSSNATVGKITANSSSTTYATTSDYRLKTDVQAVTNATNRLKQLNPVNFEWIADGTRVDGFLAHEAQTVVPEAVTGTQDAMRDEEYEVTPAVLDDDGNVVTEAVMGTRSVPDYQGIDQSKLVPLLTAALQEALTKIDALETRITALEG